MSKFRIDHESVLAHPFFLVFSRSYSVKQGSPATTTVVIGSTYIGYSYATLGVYYTIIA